MFTKLGGVLDDFVTLGPIGVGDCLEHAHETRTVVAIVGGEVGPSENRLTRWQQEHRHGPAAAAGHHLDRGHVDLVEIGPFLAIHLDAHEVLVHDLGNRWVFERLVLHDMAPVAGGITDAEENQFVFHFCPLKCFRTPGIPIYGVMGMLQEVRASLVDEPVRHEIGVPH